MEIPFAALDADFRIHVLDNVESAFQPVLLSDEPVNRVGAAELAFHSVLLAPDTPLLNVTTGNNGVSIGREIAALHGMTGLEPPRNPPAGLDAEAAAL